MILRDYKSFLNISKTERDLFVIVLKHARRLDIETLLHVTNLVQVIRFILQLRGRASLWLLSERSL